MKKSLIIYLFLSLSMFAFSKKAPISTSCLQTEMRVNPKGLDCITPRLSWEISSEARDVQQLCYHVLVSSSLDKLNKDEGDLWDSGLVTSNQSVYIPYGGQALASRMKCYWKVKVKTNQGTTSWSEPSNWEMGLMHPTDWQALWIGRSFPADKLEGKTSVPARYVRKSFYLKTKKVQKATLYVSGLGFYEAFLNSQKLGDQVLAPTPTDYSKSVKYNTFDVTGNLSGDENVIGVVLGNGRYSTMRMPGVRHFGLPCLLAQLEVVYEDGDRDLIATDTSWKITADGPILANNEFDGEAYDARKEMPGWNTSGFDDQSWLQAELVTAPGGRMEAQLNRNIKIMDTVKPIALNELGNGAYVLDMGQNMVGWLRMQVKGERGDQVKLRFAELLQKDGTLYTANLRSADCTDTYVMKGTSPETWEPTFTYHGFRYVELRGFREKPSLADFEGQVIYDEMELTGKWVTSDTLLNRIYQNSYWGIRSNYRGMPTDCPQRDERMGWLGDRAVGSQGESYMFNNHLLYAKWLDDIEQAQKESGAVPDVAPNYWDVCTDNMTWPGAYLIIANMLYEQFGDLAPIVKHYDSMKKWMYYMKDKYMVDHIMTKDNFGDWCMPPESPELIHSKDPSRITEAAVLGTTFYYYLSGLMSRFATLVGHAQDADAFQQEALAVKDAFNTKYFHADAGYYGNNTVTANILSLRFGMVPEQYQQAVFANIVEKTMKDFNGHVSTGLVGIQQLMRGLSDYGRSDLAYQIATNRTYPSWGYMVDKGATTIWELWNGDTADPAMNSANHVMLLGDLIVWNYGYLAGINNTPGSVGFKHITLKPYPVKGLGSVKASFRSVHGEIKSDWRKEQGHFLWNITVPCNTSAKVYVPVTDAKMDRKEQRLLEKEGAKFVGVENGYAVFDFPSGSYSLKTRYAE